MNTSNIIKWSIIPIILLVIFAWIYSNFTYTTSHTSTVIIVAIAAMLLGIAFMFLFNKAYAKNNAITIKESSHTIIESMRKVFKIVTAEGQFNEIYNYEESSKLFGFIPTQKKALVIISAKTMIGYDFEKCQWEVDEQAQTITLISFPEPEILSIDTDYKYYNIEENLFNKFSREDLAQIQKNGKTQVILAAKNSKLPQIAAEQMRVLIAEMFGAKNWQIKNIDKISPIPTLAIDEKSQTL